VLQTLRPKHSTDKVNSSVELTVVQLLNHGVLQRMRCSIIRWGLSLVLSWTSKKEHKNGLSSKGTDIRIVIANKNVVGQATNGMR
jgi:hypothetical protein